MTESSWRFERMIKMNVHVLHALNTFITSVCMTLTIKNDFCKPAVCITVEKFTLTVCPN